MEVLVSVIVPIYNVEKYIEKCARSLLEQTYNNIQYVFINDCTKDNSIEILKKTLLEYPNRLENVKIVNHKTNMGLACARNTGIENASGDFVVHVDSDDTIDIRTIELCVNKAVEEKADAVIFGMRHLMASGEFFEHVYVPENHQTYIKQLLTRKALVCMCGGLYKRSLYVDNNVGAIPGLNMGEDYSTKPRLLYYAKRVVALDLPLYNYNHINEQSYTRVFNSNRIDNLQKAINVLSSFFSAQTDYDVYKDSLNAASLSSKVILLKSWAISKSSKSDFRRIRKLYEDIDVCYIESCIDRLILYLTKMNMSFVVRIIVLGGVKIKSLIR